MAIRCSGVGCAKQPLPPTSDELVDAYNYPVLWNAFKKLASHLSDRKSIRFRQGLRIAFTGLLSKGSWR